VVGVGQEPDLERTGPAAAYAVQIRLAKPWIALEAGRFYLRGGMRGTARIAYRQDQPLLGALYDFLTGAPPVPQAARPGRIG